MKGIEVPDRAEDFSADPVELFFDLAYVFAFSQLTGRLIAGHTWTAVGETGLIFGLLWLPWQQLTWSANAVSGNGRRVRLIMLAATAACVPMAASTAAALTDGGPVFAVCLTVIMALGFAIQTGGVTRGTPWHSAVMRWITPNLLAIALLLGGAALEGGARIVVWSASLVVVVVAMALAGRGAWQIRPGHFAERHGLIVIIALGEVIVAIGLPVVAALKEHDGLAASTIVALVASGAFAALLWWGYFDRIGPALEHRAVEIEGDVALGRYVRDVYAWAHAPLVAGIILSAAALEEITLHPGEPLQGSFRAMLIGGLAAVTASVVLSIWRAFQAVAWERMAMTGVIAVVVAGGGSITGVVLLGAVVVIMAAGLYFEHVRIEH